METVSCRRKIIYIRAATQKCTTGGKRKQNKAKKETTEYIRQEERLK